LLLTSLFILSISVFWASIYSIIELTISSSVPIVAHPSSLNILKEAGLTDVSIHIAYKFSG